MTMQPAQIILSHGTLAVELVPSLRAATTLERLHDGFPALLDRVRAFDLSTIRQIIAASAKAPDAILNALTDAPLRTIRDVTLGPVLALLSGLMLTGDDTDQETARTKPDAQPVAWSDLFKQLYQIATGWLGWTPATAWSATISEITDAFDGMIARIKATAGTADDPDNADTMTADQREQNIALGLDPEFDRAALHALRAKHT